MRKKDLRPATWTGGSSELVFLLPDGSARQLVADRVDHPMSMCQLLDAAFKLNPFERRAIIAWLTEMETTRLRRLSARKEE